LSTKGHKFYPSLASERRAVWCASRKSGGIGLAMCQRKLGSREEALEESQSWYIYGTYKPAIFIFMGHTPCSGLLLSASSIFIFIHMCLAFLLSRLLTTMFTILSSFHILCNRMEGRRNMKVRHCRRMIRTKKTFLGWKEKK